MEQYKTKVREFIEKYPFDKYLVTASEKTKVDKEYLFLAACVLLFGIFFIIFGTNLIIDLVGFVYPLYLSLKALETEDKHDDKQWLTYWIIFSLFKVFETVADYMISSIPMYFLIKVAFLLWCYHPDYFGATVVYDSLIKPFIVPALGLAQEETHTKKE